VLSLAWTCQWGKLREHSQHFVTQLKNGNRCVVVTETGSYLRLIDVCITQLKAQGPSRTCNESKEDERSSPETLNPYHVVHRVSSSLLGPVVPSVRALSGRLKFTVRRHQFNKDSLPSSRDRVRPGGVPSGSLSLSLSLALSLCVSRSLSL